MPSIPILDHLPWVDYSGISSGCRSRIQPRIGLCVRFSLYNCGRRLIINYANSTASMQFANGSVRDVVKLKGGASYKETMRRLFGSDDRFSQDKGDFTAHLSIGLPHMTSIIGSSVHLQTVLDHVTSFWPGKSPSPTSAPEAQSLLWMLKALKAATETYLEEQIQYIEVTNPVPLGIAADTYMETISSATSGLGLSLGRPYFYAARAAAKAYNIKGTCEDWNDADADANDTSYRLFLAVNHNRAAFTASLMI